MHRISLKKNFIYSILYQILVMILPLITAPYVARVLGAENIGIHAYAQATANYFVLFSMLGVNQYGNRAVARVRDHVEERSRTFWEIYVFQLICSFVMTGLYAIGTLWFFKDHTIIFALQFFYVLSSWADVNWFCFGMERFRLTTLRSAVIKIASAAAVFIWVQKEADLWKYALIISLSTFLSAMAVWPFVWRSVLHIKPERQGVLRHVKPNLMLFIPVVAISLYNIMDRLMLGYLGSKEELAFYTYAEKIVTIPNTLILAMDNVVMPRMSNLLERSARGEAKRLMDRVMLMAMFMSCAMAFGMASLGQEFAIWFYGKSFARCGLFIVWLSPVILFKGWAGALRTQYIIPSGHDRIYILSILSGAAVNLLLNVLLIPKLWGIGAIIGTVMAELTVLLVQWILCAKLLPLKAYLMDGAAFSLIGALMYVILGRISTPSSPVWSMLMKILCGGVFFTLCVAAYLYIFRRRGRWSGE